MSIKNLDILFNPQRIAVIGASDDDQSVGYHIFRNLIGKGFKGIVYPVNSSLSGVQGIEAYSTVNDIPYPIDLAMVATKPEYLQTVIKGCGQKGVKGVVMLAPDYKYTAKDSSLISEQIGMLSSKHGCRVLGPNSLGFLKPATNLNASLYPKMVLPGNIAFISESGIFSTAFLEHAIRKKIGFSYFISLGTKLDINFADTIDFLAGDASTRALFLYIETIKKGQRFMTSIRNFARTKPIVVVKPGNSDVFSVQSISNTNLILEEDLIYDAVFKRAGCLRVDSIDDLLCMVDTIAKQRRPKGKRLLIISNSSAPSKIASDALQAMNGSLAEPLQETVNTISDRLPIKQNLRNPLYLMADASAKDYQVAIESCLRDNGVDGILIICIPFPGIDLGKIAKAIVSASKINSQIPLFSTWFVEETASDELDFLNNNGIPTYFTTEQAVKSFMYMYRYDYNLKLLRETPEILLKDFSPNLKNAENLIKKCIAQKRFSLHADEAGEILSAYGIPVIETVRVGNEGEAVSVARLMGYPVVMKIDSADIRNNIRKGVEFQKLNSSHEVKDAFFSLQNSLTSLQDSEARVIVQPRPRHTTNDYEFVIGARKSGNFGTVILFGLGGGYLLAEKDYSIGLPPLNQTLARRMMEETKIYRYLQGNTAYRGALRYLEEMLVRFSQLIIDLPQIGEIEINPILLTENEGVVRDVVIQVDTQLPREYRWRKGDLCPLHLSIPPYPFKYEKITVLRDGTTILIRPIRAEDEPILRCFLESLSNESVFLRFGSQRINMPHENLARLCQVDYDRDLAFLAVLQEEKKEEIIGDARLNKFADFDTAELSFVVADQWRGRGIGNTLMDYCITVAKDIGIKTLLMEIMKTIIE
ncbi:MAG: GNAT family N-acetyltransferase [Desulfobulbaceae bacterium]|nr:GNAT family N-acetyltransferase [Desulfobulbaceae bacterium]